MWDARISYTLNGHARLIGQIHVDSKFLLVQTSNIVSVDGDNFKTVNSIYEIQSWAVKPDPDIEWDKFLEKRTKEQYAKDIKKIME